MPLETVILDLIENASKKNSASAVLMLGGASGPGGGVGGPPGGFTGRLPQGRIAYDETEAETDYTPASGTSLVDNLNHIRYRLSNLEASGVGGVPNLTVKDDGVTVITDANTLDFIGASVSMSGNTAIITISGGSSTGHTIQDEGSNMTARSKLNFIGTAVTVTDNAGNDSTDVEITISGVSSSSTDFLVVQVFS